MFGLQISDAVKDLIINIINIIVLFVIVKSLAYKPVKNFLDARKARIDESLKNAENKNAEADALKAQYEDALKQSKQESDKIIGEAELSAQKRAAEITSDADKKAADITEKARKDAEREYNERMSGLKADVTDIAFDISKKILSREVTDADNMAIADEFFSKYGEKEEKVVITAAENMSDATYARICRGFREKLGDDLKFERVTDNSIIGGFIADADGEIYDLSISSQLKEMQKKIDG